MSTLPTYRHLSFNQRPDLFDFDPVRAAEPARFMEKFIRLTGDFEGQPMRLLDYQREVLSAVYGWTWREGEFAGRRRFRRVFTDGPKSIGKSAMFSAWGLYHLFYDRIDRPHVISTAATYRQAAGVIFRLAKDMTEQSPSLDAMCERLDKCIRVKETHGLWEIASSLNKASSGFSPSLTILDELHEFPLNSAAGLDKAERNAVKRRGALFIIATNTGADPESPWGKWRQRAESVMTGEREEIDLLPVIFSAPPDADISSPAVWHQANPAIGTLVTESQYAADYQRTIGDKGAEIAFRRLGLGQRVEDEQAWINMDRWRACQIDAIPDNIRCDAECFIGVDLGPVRDITGIAYVFAHRPTNRLYVEVDQFIPTAAARAYEHSHCVPYSLWASDRDETGQEKRPDITLLDVAAIDAEPQIALAAHIAARVKGCDVRLCAYDYFKADHLIFSLQKTHGVPCEPIRFTTFGIGPACRDFEARLATGSISFVRNECLDWQARNIAVVVDKSGFALPTKPGHGRTAMNGWKKIDGLMAVLYAMARATRITDPSPAQQIAGWSGSLRRPAVKAV